MISEEMAKQYIAVVEDDESLCRSLSRLLRASGYQPVSYLSAEAFLNDAKRPAFDCLIADIQLGGISGIELSKMLADSGSVTPVIFLTALVDLGEFEKMLPKRYAALIHKNDPGEVVLAAVNKAIYPINNRA